MNSQGGGAKTWEGLNLYSVAASSVYSYPVTGQLNLHQSIEIQLIPSVSTSESVALPSGMVMVTASAISGGRFELDTAVFRYDRDSYFTAVFLTGGGLFDNRYDESNKRLSS